jgi:hypothetical protein
MGSFSTSQTSLKFMGNSYIVHIRAFPQSLLWNQSVLEGLYAETQPSVFSTNLAPIVAHSSCRRFALHARCWRVLLADRQVRPIRTFSTATLLTEAHGQSARPSFCHALYCSACARTAVQAPERILRILHVCCCKQYLIGAALRQILLCAMCARLANVCTARMQTTYDRSQGP